ncbi:MAG: hypothetical protein DRJ98_00975 [Thermoprotei archaeon]|nr:MAG: hypothetical protein DRJ98_00975 [Thermoprotei archaeon]
MLQGRVLGIRRGLNRQYQREALIKVEGVGCKEEAARLVGAKVELKWRGNKAFVGRVVSLHGDGGTIVARFRKPLPGGVAGMEASIIL